VTEFAEPKSARNPYAGSAAPELAIIIPTCNPDERILSRTIKAIESLEFDNGAGFECVIVDNNSKNAVSGLNCVKAFMARFSWARVIVEPRQGLVFSRLAGIRVTTAPAVIVFDDDNEPATDYLKIAQNCLQNWPSVAVWGPGNINVEFVDAIPEWFRREFRRYFNEKQQRDVAYGCVLGTWCDFYPIGMGQIIRRAVAQRYVQAVEQGMLTATGRNGRSMASAEDIQLVWEAVKMGFAAGMHPELQVTHLIPAKRCTIAYVNRVVFGCASSYLPALVQSFPSETANVSKRVPSSWHILKTIFRIALRNILRLRVWQLTPELAGFIGDTVGWLRASDSKGRRWVFGLVKLLNFE
jgi:Glycosyl transferase family 2